MSTVELTYHYAGSSEPPHVDKDFVTLESKNYLREDMINGLLQLIYEVESFSPGDFITISEHVAEHAEK